MTRHAYHTVDYDRTQDWRDQAKCKGADPGLFFPGGRDPGANRRRTRIAKDTYCHKCPVVDACLADALAKNDQVSIRGGLTAKERRALP